MMDIHQQALQSRVGYEAGPSCAAAAAAVENSLHKIAFYYWPFWVSAWSFKMPKLFENEYHDGANQIRKDHKNMYVNTYWVEKW